MTPSAARGILDAILWKPEFQWYVRKIVVLNPVKFLTIKRNEINSKQGITPIIIEQKRAQRNSIILKDVAYIIEASIFQKEHDPNNLPTKYVNIFRRRVRKGQCWHRPFFGTREFAAEFSELEGAEQPIKETIPIGRMLFDMFFDEQGKPTPLYFFDVAIDNGILNCEVPENERMMASSHIRPNPDDKFSVAIYEFNQQEERGQCND
jgi:CRISPR-associated protein Cas5d